MQIERLFEIVYLLLGRDKVTAKELAERLSVSERTIYRDIDTLSLVGIPVYTTKGKGGGISLLDHFVLNRALLSEREQKEVLFSLQSMAATGVSDARSAADKLRALFLRRDEPDWIRVDFSNWGDAGEERARWDLLKEAILSHRAVEFEYYSTKKEVTHRTVEPLQLWFKGQAWYLRAFCLDAEDFRTFKLHRIQELELLNRGSTHQIGDLPGVERQGYTPIQRPLRLVLRFRPEAGYRILEEFASQRIQKEAAGGYLVEVDFIEDDWIYQYLLSFGELVCVVKPDHVKKKMRQILEESLKNYL